eukprot:jgi/Tetstr1/432254/TSEL_002289.t1
MAAVESVTSKVQFSLAVLGSPTVVCHFWAAWSEPCKQMDMVLEELAKEHSGMKFVRVEAEEVYDVSEKYNVASVPYVVFLKNGKQVDTLDGADVPALVGKVKQLAGGSVAPAAAPATVAPAPGSTQDVTARIKALLAAPGVLLFMKGNAEEARCGFSRRVVDALQATGVPFRTFDILGDEEVRQGLKTYSDWPTFPQLYVNGELLGGCDIVEEMSADGSLKEALSAAPEDVTSRIKALLEPPGVLLFMKGEPAAPRCGFSRRVVEALQATGVPFRTFDILGDEEVRQGLKTYSDWPTFPQLYVNGELMGGCDIVEEMATDGSLKEALNG